MAANVLALLEIEVSQRRELAVVERMQLDVAVHELVLNRALQADEAGQLQLGKLAAAELILTAKLLKPDDDGRQHLAVRITESLTGAIRGATVTPIDELTVTEAAKEVAGYLAVVVSAPATAGVSVAVVPFESLGRFDRLRPLERGLRDMIAARLLEYRRFQVLQRSEMRFLFDEIDLVRSGLADPQLLPATLPNRKAAYVLRGTVDERHVGDELRVIVRAELLHAETRKLVNVVELESTVDRLPHNLSVHLHRLAEALLADAGAEEDFLATAPGFDEVEHLLELAVRDLDRFWRRKPRDFSFRGFRLPGRQSHDRNRHGRIPVDSPLGTALLRKSVDRLESVLYLQPEGIDAAYALAFCLSCHVDGLWQPERTDRLLRQVFHTNPTSPLAAEALNLLAEMYYHHFDGSLKPADRDAARAQILFAFTNMPRTHRDFEWPRLVELLTRIDGQQRDDARAAGLLRLVAELAEEPGTKWQQQLARYATAIALLQVRRAEDPRLRNEACDLLDGWRTSDQHSLQIPALESLARLAEGDKDYQAAANLYCQSAELSQARNQAGDEHVHCVALLNAVRCLRTAGDAAKALELVESFQPQDRRPTSLINGRYGLELGACLEVLGRTDAALDTYVAYAEASSHLADNSDVMQRIAALGGVPLRPERDIDVRYIESPDGRPIQGQSLATDGKRLFLGGDYRTPSSRGVSALNLSTEDWESIGGPDVRASCLACDAGLLWMGTDDEGVWRCDLATKQWKRWNLADGLPDNAVVDVAAHDEVAYVSIGSRNSGGVVRIDRDGRVHVFDGQDAPRVALHRLAIHDQSLYGTNAGLYQIDSEKDTWHRHSTAEVHGRQGVTSIFQASGGLWGSTHGREIFRLGASSEENVRYQRAWFPRGLGKAGYDVRFLLAHEGQLWFGGSPWWRFKSAGFYRLDPETGRFVIYGPRDGFRLSTTYECYDGVTAADRIWLATSSGLAEITLRD